MAGKGGRLDSGEGGRLRRGPKGQGARAAQGAPDGGFGCGANGWRRLVGEEQSAAAGVLDGGGVSAKERRG
jgi:hypothetical protein